MHLDVWQRKPPPALFLTPPALPPLACQFVSAVRRVRQCASCPTARLAQSAGRFITRRSHRTTVMGWKNKHTFTCFSFFLLFLSFFPLLFLHNTWRLVDVTCYIWLVTAGRKTWPRSWLRRTKREWLDRREKIYIKHLKQIGSITQRLRHLAITDSIWGAYNIEMWHLKHAWAMSLSTQLLLWGNKSE